MLRKDRNMSFLNKEKVVRSIIIVKYQRPILRNSNDIAITAVVVTGDARDRERRYY